MARRGTRKLLTSAVLLFGWVLAFVSFVHAVPGLCCYRAEEKAPRTCCAAHEDKDQSVPLTPIVPECSNCVDGHFLPGDGQATVSVPTSSLVVAFLPSASPTHSASSFSGPTATRPPPLSHGPQRHLLLCVQRC